MMNWFKRKWYGLEDLNSLERLILDKAKEKLEPDALEIWDAQILAINKVSRLPDGVKVSFIISI